MEDGILMEDIFEEKAAVDLTKTEPALDMDEEETKVEKRTKRIYIGPSIPRSNLRNAQILSGTEKEIAVYIDTMAKQYPEIKYLIVSPDKLSAAQNKVRQKGNILHKYYQDMLAQAIVFRRGG